MSRTIRNKKDPSYEYWSARPGNKAGGIPGSFTKHVTHKRERQQAKRLSQTKQVDNEEA